MQSSSIPWLPKMFAMNTSVETITLFKDVIFPLGSFMMNSNGIFLEIQNEY